MSAGTPAPESAGKVGGRPTASLWRRLASLAYEALLLTALTLVVGFLTVPLAGPKAPAASAPALPTLPARAMSGLLVFAAAGAYFGWSWSGGRRTLPMKTWGLGLERRNFRPVDGRTALVRYLAAWIGPAAALAAYAALHAMGSGTHAAWFVALNYLWAFADPDRQFLHDRIAGTRIVRMQGASGAR